MARRMMGYREAIEWVVLNDDTEFLDHPHGGPSVTAVFLADVYDREVDEVVRALRKQKEKSFG